MLKDLHGLVSDIILPTGDCHTTCNMDLVLLERFTHQIFLTVRYFQACHQTIRLVT